MTHTDDALTEAVERAARAIFAELDGREDWETWDVLPDEWKDGHRRQARAAIAAAGTAPGQEQSDLTTAYLLGESRGRDAAVAPEPGMDELLDSVHPKCVLNRMYELRAGGWEVRITTPDAPDENGWYDYTGNEVIGTGPTRMVALRNAVAHCHGHHAGRSERMNDLREQIGSAVHDARHGMAIDDATDRILALVADAMLSDAREGGEGAD